MTEQAGEPIVVGLTGGIGSGKSQALRFLTALGAEGIDADRVTHEVMALGGPAYQPIIAEFGREIVGSDGQLDRRRLAAQVFADPAALARLEAITHPAVAEAIRARIAATPAPLVVIEAIKLLEAGLSRQLCDEVWVTLAHRDQQVARLMATRHMTAEEIDRRLASQMPPEQMAEQADRIIDTSGTVAETGLQVLGCWAGLGLPFPLVELRPMTANDAEGVAAVLNGIVREGGLTVVDHIYSVKEERAFLQSVHPRFHMTVATVAGIIAAFQEIDVYATYTGAMDHVATMGTFVAAPLRCRKIGQALAQVSLAYAREAGFQKIVIQVRADNPDAQGFYTRLGFNLCGRLAKQALFDGQYVDELLYELFL
jgi:dephospho-CoA kinase